MASLDPKNIDDGMFIIAAFRYALGRRTYAVDCIITVLKRLIPEIKPLDLDMIVQEIEEAIKKKAAGDLFDEENWLELKDLIQKVRWNV